MIMCTHQTISNPFFFLKGNMVGLIETIWISLYCGLFCPVWQYWSVGHMELVKQMIGKQVIAVCCLFVEID